MTFKLEREARDFAQVLQNTLNRTICTNVIIKAALRPITDGGHVFTVGHGLSRSNLTQPTGFPVRIDSRKPRIWMNLSYQVRADAEQRYLAVHSSYCGIFADENLESCLCHFDYERDKEHYTSAHLQVHGDSASLDALNRGSDRRRPLEKLHFPVGGKRYRPCLEDIIEFLVAERLADPLPGYEQILEDGRALFQRNQLRAAMRRNPEVVKEFIDEQAHEGI